VSKHAILGMTEQLAVDLSVAQAPIGVSVLWPANSPQNIGENSRTIREMAFGADAEPDRTVRDPVDPVRAAASALDMGRLVVDAARTGRFYVLTHPSAPARMQTGIDHLLDGSLPPAVAAPAPVSSPRPAATAQITPSVGLRMSS
jgi:NAD(P)-dependent dehydrogenase (short-subunit alcohol dehydrogenase family)